MEDVLLKTSLTHMGLFSHPSQGQIYLLKFLFFCIYVSDICGIFGLKRDKNKKNIQLGQPVVKYYTLSPHLEPELDSIFVAESFCQTTYLWLMFPHSTTIHLNGRFNTNIHPKPYKD